MPKKTDAMFAQLRKKGILEHVNQNGIATVQELCERFDVSPAWQALAPASVRHQRGGGRRSSPPSRAPGVMPRCANQPWFISSA